MARLPILRHMIFDHNSAIFGPIRLKIFMGSHDIIIYRLVVRNPNYDAYFLFFGPLLAGKWAWSPHVPLMACGLQTRPENWPLALQLGGTFGPTTILFENYYAAPALELALFFEMS